MRRKKYGLIALLLSIATKVMAWFFIVMTIIVVVFAVIIVVGLRRVAQKINDPDSTHNQTQINVEDFFSGLGDPVWFSEDYRDGNGAISSASFMWQSFGDDSYPVNLSTFQYAINNATTRIATNYPGHSLSAYQTSDLTVDKDGYQVFVMQGYGETYIIDMHPYANFVTWIDEDTNVLKVVIERSTDLIHWQPIATNDEYYLYTVETFTDPEPPAQHAFYRTAVY